LELKSKNTFVLVNPRFGGNVSFTGNDTGSPHVNVVGGESNAIVVGACETLTLRGGLDDSRKNESPE
jgi:hypothetical protein